MSDDFGQAMFDFLILIEIVAGLWFVWVEALLPIYKNYTTTNGLMWIPYSALAVLFFGFFMVLIRVTWGEKDRRYPPKPKQVAVSVSPPSPRKPPSAADLDDIEERLEKLESNK